MTEKKTSVPSAAEVGAGYDRLLGEVSSLLEHARRASARAVNAILTATYWETGRHIVEFEQGGQARAEYGESLLKRLSEDLTARFGRGFAHDNLQRMRLFYSAYPAEQIYATPSRKSLSAVTEPTCEKSSTPSRNSDSAVEPTAFLQTPSGESRLKALAGCFPRSWSAYVRLLSVKNEKVRAFYETEALRGGWSVRQLDRQIATQFYEGVSLRVSHGLAR